MTRPLLIRRNPKSVLSSSFFFEKGMIEGKGGNLGGLLFLPLSCKEVAPVRRRTPPLRKISGFPSLALPGNSNLPFSR